MNTRLRPIELKNIKYQTMLINNTNITSVIKGKVENIDNFQKNLTLLFRLTLLKRRLMELHKCKQRAKMSVRQQ